MPPKARRIECAGLEVCWIVEERNWNRTCPMESYKKMRKYML